MDEVQSKTRNPNDIPSRHRQAKPAIGIDAVTHNFAPAVVAETVQRVSRFDTEIFVVVPADAPAIRRKLESTVATLVEPTVPEETPRQALATAGKQRGIPGMILHPQPASDAQLAYKKSVTTYNTSEGYVVTGHSTKTKTTTNHLAAVVRSEHDTSITALYRELQEFVDEILVVDDTDDPATTSDETQLEASGSIRVVTTGEDESGITTVLHSLTRFYPDCDAAAVLDATATSSICQLLPELLETAASDDVDLVIGREINEAAETHTKAGLGGRLRGRIEDGGDAPRSDFELENGIQAMTPEAARTIERQVNAEATRLSVVDAAIRSDLAVREHIPEPTAATSGATATETPSDHSDRVLVGRDSNVAPTVSVVMPTMNEEDGIRECIERVKRAVTRSGYRTEVIISDDSDDRTPEIARQLGAIVVTPDNPGYGYAYRYAFERCRGDYIVIGDADTTYDFERFPALLDPVVNGEADMVMGSRLNGDIKDGAMPPLHQYIGNPVLTWFLNAFYDAGVSDAHSGFRAFRAGMLDELDLETDGMEFASEMIMDAGARDLTIEEIPITYHEREGEATLESFRDGWRHIRFMLLNAPGYLFTGPGIGMGALGILVMLAVVANVTLGDVTFGIHTSIAGALLTMVGYQVANLGVFATVASDPIQRSDNLLTNIIERLTLERMATIGSGVWLAGVTYAGWLVVQWAATGFTQLPMRTGDVLAFTAIVIGLQTVFNAFFLSAVSHSQ